MKNSEANEARMCEILHSKYKLRIEKSCFSTGAMPNYIILDSTRNIHSYVEFCDIQDGVLTSIHIDNKQPLIGLVDVLRTQYSQLDRPLFFIFSNSNETLMTIESQIVREHLLYKRDDDISTFIITNADKFQDVLPLIYREL